MATGKPILTTVIIDGICVDRYLYSWENTNNWEQEVGDCVIVLTKKVENVLSLSDLSIGFNVTVQRGVNSATEEYIFRGEIVGIEFDGARYVLNCKDKLYASIKLEITKSFDKDIDTEAGKVSEIINTLMTTYAGLSTSASSIQDSGTSFLLTKFICNHATIFERAKELADTINWHLFYDADTDLVNFQPKGYVLSDIILQVGTNISAKPKWKYNSEKMVNKITIIGAEQEVETTEFFNGNASNTNFSITKTPVSVKIWVGTGVYDPSAGTFPHDSNDNLKVGGKEGSTSTTFDYQVDSENKKIIFESTSVPPSGTKNVEISISHMLPAPVVMTNSYSIDVYGEHQKTIFKVELKTIADAENYGTKQLDRFSLPFISSELRVTNTTGINPGEVIRVIDTLEGIDRWLLITQIKKTYPYKYDTVLVGDELWKTAEWEAETDIRIRRLEEEMGKNQDLLLHVIKISRTMKINRRYFKLMKKQYELTDSVFILGHRNFAVLGTNYLGDSSGRVEKLTAMIPGNLTFEEYIYDNDFTESGTTATVDTTNHEIRF